MTAKQTFAAGPRRIWRVPFRGARWLANEQHVTMSPWARLPWPSRSFF